VERLKKEAVGSPKHRYENVLFMFHLMTLLSSPVYTVSDGRMISEQRLGEYVERRGHGLI
jgi:hypothetical protein